MTKELQFSDSELNLVLELLEREQKELRVEIRHTDTAEFKAGLRARFATIETLLARIRPAHIGSF